MSDRAICLDGPFEGEPVRAAKKKKKRTRKKKSYVIGRGVLRNSIPAVLPDSIASWTAPDDYATHVEYGREDVAAVGRFLTKTKDRPFETPGMPKMTLDEALAYLRPVYTVHASSRAEARRLAAVKRRKARRAT